MDKKKKGLKENQDDFRLKDLEEYLYEYYDLKWKMDIIRETRKKIEELRKEAEKENKE